MKNLTDDQLYELMLKFYPDGKEKASEQESKEFEIMLKI